MDKKELNKDSKEKRLVYFFNELCSRSQTADSEKKEGTIRENSDKGENQMMSNIDLMGEVSPNSDAGKTTPKDPATQDTNQTGFREDVFLKLADNTEKKPTPEEILMAKRLADSMFRTHDKRDTATPIHAQMADHLKRRIGTLYYVSDSKPKLFYVYDKETRIYNEWKAEKIKNLLYLELRQIVTTLRQSRQKSFETLADKIELANREQLHSDVLKLIQNELATDENLFKYNRGNPLFLDNVAIDFQPYDLEKPLIIKELSEELLCVSKSSIVYHEDAECPQFKEFLSGMLRDDDITLLQKYVGMMLYGINLTQNCLIVDGVGGIGKGTLFRIITAITGGTRYMEEMREDYLRNNRFEFRGMKHIRFTYTPDASPDFFVKAWSTLKKLIGGDTVKTESKNSNQKQSIDGNIPFFANMNGSPRLPFNNDKEAQRRRLLTVTAERKRLHKVEPNLDSRLIEEEGSGILNFFLDGFKMLVKDISKSGRIELTEAQKAKIEALVDKSDTVDCFVRTRVAKIKTESPAHRYSTTKIFLYYKEFCEDNDMIPVKDPRYFGRQLKKAMMEHHGLKRVNVMVDGRYDGMKGYEYIFIEQSDS